MRASTRTIAALGMAVVATLAGSANAGSTDKATGGGQILLSSDGRGPGDTITFSAQRRADGSVVGNVNLIDRTDNTGKGGVHFRGDVICIDVEGNQAILSGVGEYKDGTTTAYTLIVQDNGEGAAADNDLITFTKVDDPSCDREDGDDDAAVELARGNAQVTDGIS